RPPNAFMLFRSDFLKRHVIPRSVEKRQQTLSRVAGEIWNLMPAEEKKSWYDKAAEALTLHKKKYPNYKF
ncbi:high mobility group box domain-containing protein, partial [Lentinula aff. detonsa]